MDLVSTVRKEGSRGGRGDFQWSEVQTSQHRENYLGHSLMAPVGRWQKKKDLSWYAKAGDDNDDDGLTLEERAAKERKEEFQRIKQAEKEALSKALGYEINEDGPLGGGGAGSGANSVAVAPKRIGPAAPPLEAKKERKEKRRDRSRSRERRHYERLLREAANLIGGIVTVTVTEGEGELTTMMIVVRDPMIERVPGTMGDAIPKGRMMSRLRAIIGAEMAPKKEDTAVVHLRLIESYLTIL
ncbi:MAG: hypothetical protein MMC23_000298 [Stictis urceolatum]|nr:hypothetical protein [Stictis urceolata]